MRSARMHSGPRPLSDFKFIDEDVSVKTPSPVSNPVRMVSPAEEPPSQAQGAGAAAAAAAAGSQVHGRGPTALSPPTPLPQHETSI